MKFSKEELEVLQDAIGSLVEEAQNNLNQFKSDSEEKLQAQKRLEILRSINSRLLNSESNKNPETGTPTAGLKQSFNKNHLLIVDDDELFRKHTILILEQHGFNRFDEAKNGKEAIEKIKTKIIPYDLILCDMYMPVISGLELLNFVRGESSCANIPFIMLTAETNKEVLLKAIKAGVSDFVAKPIDEDNLLKKMTALGIKRGSWKL